MEAASVRQERVDERAAEVDAASRRLEHPLDQITQLRLAKNGGRQLVASLPRDENTTRLVDHDLFHGGIIEVALQRTEAGNGVEDLTSGLLGVIQGGQATTDASVLVLSDDVVNESTYRGRIDDRIDPAATHELANLGIDDRDGRHAEPPQPHAPAPAGRRRVVTREQPAQLRGVQAMAQLRNDDAICDSACA